MPSSQLNEALIFFTATPTPEIYTLSLHDALPISSPISIRRRSWSRPRDSRERTVPTRSEEHTSELQSRFDLVCRLLLEKKKRLGSSRQKTNSTCPPTTGPMNRVIKYTLSITVLV